MGYIRLPKEVEEFKNFIMYYPGVAEEVKRNVYTWQEIFDIWQKEGENSPFWDQFKASPSSEGKSSPLNSGKVHDVMKKVAELDVDQVEKNIRQLSKALDQIQQLSHQFKSQGKQLPFNQKPGPYHDPNRFPKF
ncbi:spore coat protein YlbD [Alkalibacillus aidingensis]|uniref:spore coat protein YlbD n=1 Tax=Alkalibacillus aidingensis TaxID=2747607 RepID=UPI00166099A9|nr:spore coat protein YlbD [Alkalibacillus aidingensis]